MAKKKIMFKHPAILLAYAKYSLPLSIIASIPVFFFIRDTKFSETWLLYLGDALFLFQMIVVMLIISRSAAHEAGTGSLMIAGHAITVFSIVLNCIIALVLLLIVGSTQQESLRQAPANIVLDNTHGLMFILFVNAVVGTFAAGSFATIMMSYTAKREQRGDRAEV